MPNIIIADLGQSKELDKKALTTIFGGIALLLPAVQKVRLNRLGYGGPDTRWHRSFGNVRTMKARRSPLSPKGIIQK